MFIKHRLKISKKRRLGFKHLNPNNTECEQDSSKLKKLQSLSSLSFMSRVYNWDNK